MGETSVVNLNLLMRMVKKSSSIVWLMLPTTWSKRVGLFNKLILRPMAVALLSNGFFTKMLKVWKKQEKAS